jgi:hypothetical protein
LLSNGFVALELRLGVLAKELAVDTIWRGGGGGYEERGGIYGEERRI